MKIHGEAEVLRVYVGDSDRLGGQLVHEAIVAEARKRGMAGATAMRGMLGFGANSLIHTAKILRLSEDLPVVVEIVDKPDRIAAFLPILEDMVAEGTITRHTVRATFNCPMRVREVMTSEVVTAAPDTPLSEVLRLLLDKGIKAVPVVQGRKVLGMVTGGDLLKRAGLGLRVSLHEALPQELRGEESHKLDMAGKTARDVMSGPVATVNIRARVPEAAALMAARKLKRLPVVDDAGDLAGIVSRIDILKTIATATAVADAPHPQLPKGLNLTAGDVMFRDIPTIAPEAPLVEALNKLVATPLRRVVVVDQTGHVVGIVLDRELIRRFSEEKNPGLLRALANLLSPGGAQDLAFGGTTVGEAMRPDVFTVPESMPISAVLQRMVETGGKRLVVLDDEGRLRGMVDRDTVLGIIGDAR
ncbi:MAG: signal transduction protein [Desulfovibrionaceae bacterium CG1_02_65_16]|nr:MAG: signal transduction protein [Desulfovibrionaceae bacterium CG1_02_65_16]